VQLLKLRYYQLKRDLGIWTLLIAAVVFLVSQYISSVGEKESNFLILIIFILLLNYQQHRKDLSFINNYLTYPRLQILLNYNLLCLPISIAFIYNHHFLQALILHLSYYLIVFTNTNFRNPRYLFVTSRIPPQQFEWISGIRKTMLMLIPIYLIAIVLSPVKLFGVVALFLTNVIFLSFYNDFEPLSMLNTKNLSAENFLSEKTKFLNKMILFTNLPLLIVNSIFCPEIIWFNVGFIIGFFLLGNVAIYIKYAYYEPNQSLHFNMDYLILFAAVFFPYLLPLSIYLGYSNRKKAINNLNRFL